jgi:hypothetical protein
VDPLVGWFYDAFSEKVTAECPPGRQRRIGFTQGAEPSDATVRIECPSRRGTLCGDRP